MLGIIQCHRFLESTGLVGRLYGLKRLAKTIYCNHGVRKDSNNAIIAISRGQITITNSKVITSACPISLAVQHQF